MLSAQPGTAAICIVVQYFISNLNPVLSPESLLLAMQSERTVERINKRSSIAAEVQEGVFFFHLITCSTGLPLISQWLSDIFLSLQKLAASSVGKLGHILGGACFGPLVYI